MNSPQKLLVVGPAWVGDMVMAQTLFMTLKQQSPSMLIDVLAPEWSQPLLERMPEVNHAIILPITHKQLALKVRYKIARNLRTQNYDQAIILPNSFKSVLIPFFANIPLRTGWCGEYRYGLLNDLRYLDKTQLPLMIQRFIALGLAKNAKLPQFLPKPQLIVDKINVANTLKKFNLNTDKPILALCPGAEFGSAKRWPETHYATLAKSKLTEGWQVWLFGSKNDMNVTDEISRLTEQHAINLAGKTSLAEAIDLLSLATQVVSNDSGLMHIAAALDRPLTVIYGSSSPEFTPPLTDQKQILRLNLECSPCFKRECPLGHLKCLVDLSPEQVIQALGSI